MQTKKQRREAGARRQQQARQRLRPPPLLQARDERSVSCTTFNILAPIYKRMDSEVSWILPFSLPLESTCFILCWEELPPVFCWIGEVTCPWALGTEWQGEPEQGQLV